MNWSDGWKHDAAIGEHNPAEAGCRPRSKSAMSGRSSRPPTQDVVALEDVSLDVKPAASSCWSARAAAANPLLMMMAGLRQQTSGTITISGAPIPQPDPDRVGVVFQEASLFPWLTAEENVEFPLALRGVAKSERRAKARGRARNSSASTASASAIRMSSPAA